MSWHNEKPKWFLDQIIFKGLWKTRPSIVEASNACIQHLCTISWIPRVHVLIRNCMAIISRSLLFKTSKFSGYQICIIIGNLNKKIKKASS